MRIYSVGLVATALAAAIGSTTADLGGKKLHAVNYNSRKGPDWDLNKCKARWEIDADMDTLKQITDTIRIYSLTDCEPGDVLASAAAKGLRVALGVWTTKSSDWDHLFAEDNKLKQLIDAKFNGAKIVGMHVGSEAIYRKDVDPQNAIWMMQRINDTLTGRGIRLPVTIADTIDSYNDHPELIDAVDVVSVNQFSFWEKVDANEGVARMLDRLRNVRIKAAQKGKEVVIGETGWSTQGVNENSSAPSIDNQMTFLKDFYHQATARGWSYYWFSGFDARWRAQGTSNQYTPEKEVECYFGLYQEDHWMKDSLRNLDLGSRPVKVIRSPSQQLMLTEIDGELSLTKPASDWLGKEQQQWLWDASTQQIRSMNSDRCLDAYEAWNGGRVHVWKCIANEPNQKWNFDKASGNLQHVGHPGLCLDTDKAKGNHLQMYGCSNNGNENQKWEVVDPGTPFSTVVSGASSSASSGNGNTPPGPTTGTWSASGSPSKYFRFYTKESATRGFAKLIRTGDEVAIGFQPQGEDGSEWSFDSNTHLLQAKGTTKCLDAYEPQNGGRVHVWECNPKEPNQMWNFDTTTSQFKHLTHNGFCLDADQAANNGNGLMHLWGCQLNNNNQVFRQISSNAMAMFPVNIDKTVVQWVTQDQLIGKTAGKVDAQVWFFNPFTGSITSKWSGECLDAYEPKEGGRVHTWGCNGNDNQQWSYDESAKLVRHVKHEGFCLAYDANNQVQLSSCAQQLHTAAQTFTLGLA